MFTSSLPFLWDGRPVRRSSFITSSLLTFICTKPNTISVWKIMKKKKRYSDKYKKTKKIGRTIEEHPYQLEFFPDELYSVMGISNKQKKKLLSLSKFKADGGLKQYAARESEADSAQSMLEKLKDMAEDLDSNNANNATKEDDNEEIEEEMDDDFEEDDDDDYNAEKYFDDGDDDVADDGDDEAAF